AEPRPVIVVPVDHHGDRGIFRNVAQALERHVGALRLLVDRDVERIALDREAHRHHVGRAAPIGGRAMRDLSAAEETALAVGEQSGAPRILRGPFCRRSSLRAKCERPGLLGAQGRARTHVHNQYYLSSAPWLPETETTAPVCGSRMTLRGSSSRPS